MVSVPQQIDNDGKSEFVGYVVAIPEVSRLKRFCDQLPGAFSLLATEVRGFRPAQGVIDLPAQGALEFVNSVARIKVAEQEENPTRSVSSIEFLHLDRKGNSIKVLASGRVAPDLQLLDEYREIVGRPGESVPYRNPLFRGTLIQALLRGEPWWGEMLPLFINRDARFFVPSDDTPDDIARLPWFRYDARNRLELDEEKYQHRRRTYMQMSKSDPQSPTVGEPPPLTSLITRLVRNYVYRRAEDRSGVKLDSCRDGERINWDRVPGSFNTEKAKVAEGLFLEFRSRRDQAFVDHFAQTFFAVQQYLSDRDQEQIARALLVERRVDDIKTLTLMALSATSWTPQRPSEKGNEE
jgi:CRISPR-associated protein Cmx8